MGKVFFFARGLLAWEAEAKFIRATTPKPRRCQFLCYTGTIHDIYCT